MIYFNLLQNVHFRHFFLVQLFGAVVDNVFKNALIVYLTFHLSSSGSGGILVPLAQATFIFGFLFFSAPAGKIITDDNQTSFIFPIKVWEVLLVLTGFLGFYFDSLILLYTTLIGLGIQSTFFGPIKYSYLPKLFQGTSLVCANALTLGSTNIGILLGSLWGGYALSIPDIGEFVVSITLLILALLGLLASVQFRDHALFKKSLQFKFPFFKATWQLLGEIKKSPISWKCIQHISWFWFLGAALLNLLPLTVKEVLLGNSHLFNYFFFVFSVGIFIGAISTKYLNSIPRLIFKTGLGLGIFLTLIAIPIYFIGSIQKPTTITHYFTEPLGLSLQLFILLFSFCAGVFQVSLYSQTQKYTDSELMPKAICANNVLNAFAIITASLLGILFASAGIPLVIQWLLFGIIALIYPFIKIRRLDESFTG